MSLTPQAIKYLRQRAGMSARSLSIKANLSPAYVFKLENGMVQPSLQCFAKIAVALGMTPTEAWVCLMSEATEATEASQGEACSA